LPGEKRVRAICSGDVGGGYSRQLSCSRQSKGDKFDIIATRIWKGFNERRKSSRPRCEEQAKKEGGREEEEEEKKA
jgi:hypothetical protein